MKSSVRTLLATASSSPCSTAAQTFMALVPEMARFQISLDVLLPALSDRSKTAEERVLVAYVLYALYAAYPLELNPFKSTLEETLEKERNSVNEDVNERVIWVLSKVLQGEGNYLGSYSPRMLAHHGVAEELREGHPTLPNIGQSGASRLHQENQASPGLGMDAVRALSLLQSGATRVLTLSEQRLVLPLIPSLPLSAALIDIPSFVSHNAALAHPLFVALLTSSSDPAPYLATLSLLPPSLPTYDLLGRLLQDTSPISVQTGSGTSGAKTTVADLIRAEVLGQFIHEAIEWLERAQREEQEGMISDDRFAVGVRNLCRFYHSLIKLGIVDPTSDIETAEMAHFALSNSRFEEANSLYRIFANAAAGFGY
ncbi:hypothetical protein PUNSTDRAFT_147016 [Punctularia strigosozonata HHB-11173 SS5]|uniref:Uncharacterized protein n=1 Tax=Punctularia strigosozonata (strain HHB-11173) TaxID=741275 RepID=R7S2V9_PUNST|nr:uncharacterized protein PUNSTDRAFT_147016 [Punctularia strigosozonata HHB-11173 SS5]EIN03586.1 hypothetical protein PUNSTDRAFT_147016 [Punctularia strigosozonata HHB-11173 SS5]